MSDKRSLIYLCSPYSHPSPDVRQQRFLAAVDCAAQFISSGAVIYSPIVHSHPIALRHDLPQEWGFWSDFDEMMIKRCDEVVVMVMEGTEESVGVNAEIEMARMMGKPVSFCAWVK